MKRFRLSLACLVVFAGAGLAGRAQVPTAAPREIPVPPIVTRLGARPGVAALPDRPALPDPLAMNDGTRVTTSQQWSRRRNEIRQILEYYAVGAMPPAPGNVKGRVVSAQTILGGTASYRLVHLTFGPGEKLFLNIGIYTPASGGPFPAVIMPSGTPPGAPALPRLPPGPGQGHGVDALLTVGPGPAPGISPDAAVNAAGGIPPSFPVDPSTPEYAANAAERARFALARGYAYVMFNHNDCGEDTTLRNPDGSWAYRTTRFAPAYPDCDCGLLGLWAWGASRIIDYLETDSSLDARCLVISGVSRTGKAALVAGAFDDRIAVTAPVVSGGGGVGAYRFSGEGRGGKEGLDVMVKKYPNWFSPHLREFGGHTDRLPFDEHWFLALIAPRGFLALEGTSDPVSLEQAVQASVAGAQPVFALLGVPGRVGVNYADHGHVLTADDWAALLDFTDQQFRGRKVDRRFDRFPSDRP
ncbi:MAG TPA: hypothetical protein VHD61_05435 [Lacunisphaera sp.]|nr:hypothetical protein [Lacunisphaera sp.]